jgi:diketogulonate reductase-like aldo/keto reductase
MNGLINLVSANGAEIPALGFGTYRMKDADVFRMILSVVAAGYRHIDTAQIYGNEAAVGEGMIAADLKRKDLFLTTKAWISNFHPDKFQTSVD